MNVSRSEHLDLGDDGRNRESSQSRPNPRPYKGHSRSSVRVVPWVSAVPPPRMRDFDDRGEMTNGGNLGGMTNVLNIPSIGPVIALIDTHRRAETL